MPLFRPALTVLIAATFLGSCVNGKSPIDGDTAATDPDPTESSTPGPDTSETATTTDTDTATTDTTDTDTTDTGTDPDDWDGDGLSNEEEVIAETDPNLWDSDGDALSDWIDSDAPPVQAPPSDTSARPRPLRRRATAEAGRGGPPSTTQACVAPPTQIDSAPAPRQR